MKEPVLIICFNRPFHTKQVFNQVEIYKPNKLYIWIDGPRLNHTNDIENIEKVKNIFKNINWECKLNLRENMSNLGCQKSEISAMNWFFENEERGIILEDDCVPNNDFFLFCEELLERYKDEKKVMSVSGNNFVEHKTHISEDYFFSFYPGTWGWATWKRAWLLYDENIQKWLQIKNKTEWFKNYLGKDKYFANYWSIIFDRTVSNKANTWDYQWLFCSWFNKCINIVPQKNLVTNIGFDNSGTHSTSAEKKLYSRKFKNIQFPLIHPKDLIINNELDLKLEKYLYKYKLKYYINIIKKNFKKIFDL